jgi:soluble lytic murein transglycosylase-like protein
MIPVMINDVAVDCINSAAIAYHVPVKIILAVMKQEGGKNAQAVRNKNGTIDYGILQINSIWLPKIAAYGYTKEDIQYNACKNISVGVWILSKSIANGKNVWSGIGNYYSHTPGHNRYYRNNVYKHYEKIIFALS